MLCLGEFWAVVTHPNCLGGPSSLAEAYGFIRNLIEDGEAECGFPMKRLPLDGCNPLGIYKFMGRGFSIFK